MEGICPAIFMLKGQDIIMINKRRTIQLINLGILGNVRSFDGK